MLFDDKYIFSDFGIGPLTEYRKRASFDYKKLKLFIHDEQLLKFRYNIWKFVENHPIFQHPSHELTLDEERHLAMKRQYVVQSAKSALIENFRDRPDIENMFLYSFRAADPSSGVKYSLSFQMFPSVIKSLGTDRLLKYVEACNRGEISGAFALTEIGHGSNTRGMRTTATFDPIKNAFLINTPDFEAAKCWIGNLGKTCTHAVVYAQLYTADGKHHGLNAFLVPIRCPKTLKPFSGIIVGDLGHKIGLNGVDNGFILFKNYPIPRENLLARMGDVSPDGKFVATIKDPRKRMGTSLGALSAGRVSISGSCYIYLSKAITIAVRYSAARRQFGPEGSSIEYPVLEYQSQQFRLLPHLAMAFAIGIFSHWLSRALGDMLLKTASGQDESIVGMEMHALSSAAKPVCSWVARDGIQECREACGGHGYLKIAQLGNLRADNDVCCTYEGENNVLIQQASNWLLSIRSKGWSKFRDASPLGSAKFFADYEKIIINKFKSNSSNEAVKTDNLLDALNWLCCYLLERTSKRVDSLKTQGKSAFDVRNDSQVFNAQTLSIVYGQRMIFKTFNSLVTKLVDGPERAVLTRVLSLLGANLVVKYMGLFYQGGYLTGSQPAELYQEGILSLLTELKNDSISLVDAIAPPDFILNSPLGMSDGRVYEHIQNVLMTNPGTFERPRWWKDVVFRDFIKPKL